MGNVTPSKKTNQNPNRTSIHSHNVGPLPKPSPATTNTPSTVSQGPGASGATLTLTGLPKNLGKCIARDLTLLNKLGWRKFVAARRGRKDLAPMLFDHPAKRLLKHYLRRYGVQTRR
jgi:hypothetical protein